MQVSLGFRILSPNKRLVGWRESYIVPQQIWLDAPLFHLAFYGGWRKRNANRHRLSFAELILQDSQRLVERVDQEISNAVTDRLLLRRAV